jgi:hypothetical protein
MFFKLQKNSKQYIFLFTLDKFITEKLCKSLQYMQRICKVGSDEQLETHHILSMSNAEDIWEVGTITASKCALPSPMIVLFAFPTRVSVK